MKITRIAATITHVEFNSCVSVVMASSGFTARALLGSLQTSSHRVASSTAEGLCPRVENRRRAFLQSVEGSPPGESAGRMFGHVDNARFGAAELG